MRTWVSVKFYRTCSGKRRKREREREAGESERDREFESMRKIKRLRLLDTK